ncbi:MAG: iron-containing alcohol dehydrogenase [Verrucomicrobiota bacterium]
MSAPDPSPSAKASPDYNGVLPELTAGRWRDPETGQIQTVPVEEILIAETLEGREAELVARRHPGKSLLVVSGENTYAALGARVARALRPLGNVREFVWKNPRCTGEGVDELMKATAGAEALIAVGSGTVSDSVKYGAFLTKREFSVFPTAPMNAYTAPTASVSFEGFKKSISCQSARGVFFDLGVLAKSPWRLISAAFADAVASRTTSQVDWLLSHLLLGTPYREAPYTLLAYDEPALMDHADKLLSGDVAMLAALTRVCAMVGLGTSIVGTTHPSSMGEHLISHYIDMFAGAQHPGSSHGEQVGVATVTLSKLQNEILRAGRPPVLQPTSVPAEELRFRFGAAAGTMIEQGTRKALDAAKTRALNQRLDREWPVLGERLLAVTVPYDKVVAAMTAAGCPLTPADIRLDPKFYRDAVRYARFIRDRYTMLDIAGDAGLLEAFVGTLDD